MLRRLTVLNLLLSGLILGAIGVEKASAGTAQLEPGLNAIQVGYELTRQEFIAETGCWPVLLWTDNMQPGRVYVVWCNAPD